MKSSERLDLRACFSSYIVLCSSWTFLAALWTYINLRSSRPDWRPVWLCVLVGVGLAIWLGRFRLRVAFGILEYRTLFATRSIRLEEIQVARVNAISTGKGGFQRLNVYSKTSPGIAAIKINPKVFSREDITRLLDVLGEKLAGPRELGIFVKQKF